MKKTMKIVRKLSAYMLLCCMLLACGAASVEIDDGMGIRPPDIPAVFESPQYIDEGYRQTFNDEMTMALYDAINEYRKENGVELLRYNADLDQAAKVRGLEVSSKFSHERPNEKTFWTAENYGKTAICAEIFARNFDTAEDVMAAFCTSEAHLAILLDPSYTITGVCCYDDLKGVTYCAVLFGNASF